MKKQWIGIGLFIGLMGFGLVQPSQSVAATANVITVTTAADVMNGADGFCSLREAVHNANNNVAFSANAGECPAGSDAVTDVIVLTSGETYQLTIAGTGNDEGDLDILSGTPAVEVRIEASGADEATIQQTAANERVIFVDSFASVELENLVITGGQADGSGGGIFISGFGGATFAFDNVTFMGNNGDVSGGGAAIHASTGVINHSSFILNDAGTGGGAYFSDVAVVINDSIIRANEGNYGAGLYVSLDSVVTINQSVINLNIATEDGGGIYNYLNNTVTRLNYTEVVGNEAQNGGGIHNNNSSDPTSLIIMHSEITGNTASNTGGGLNGAGTLLNTLVYDNTAGLFGGGIAGHSLIGNRLTIVNNTATGSIGGGLLGRYIELTDSVVGGNTAGSHGGGIYLDSASFSTVDSVMVRVAVADNTSVAADSDGSGIWVDRKLTMANVTISSNVMPPAGSGVYIDEGSGEVTAIHVTLADHTNGVALKKYGILNLHNSILSNPATTTCESSLTYIQINSLGHNIADDTSCLGLTATGDMTGTNAMLAPLQNNGGNTVTHALLDGSPAINGADNAGCTGGLVNGFDQRGIPRPAGIHLFANQCDVGAHENGFALYLPHTQR